MGGDEGRWGFLWQGEGDTTGDLEFEGCCSLVYFLFSFVWKEVEREQIGGKGKSKRGKKLGKTQECKKFSGEIGKSLLQQQR